MLGVGGWEGVFSKSGPIGVLGRVVWDGANRGEFSGMSV